MVSRVSTTHTHAHTCMHARTHTTNPMSLRVFGTSSTIVIPLTSSEGSTIVTRNYSKGGGRDGEKGAYKMMIDDSHTYIEYV